jgi:hypothetical protein
MGQKKKERKSSKGRDVEERMKREKKEKGAEGDDSRKKGDYLEENDRDD